MLRGAYNMAPDPRALRFYLDDFFAFTGDASDCLWHHVLYARIDVEEMMELSTWRITYLARYGRQSMLQWDDVPVSRINELYTALKKLMQNESGLNAMGD